MARMIPSGRKRRVLAAVKKAGAEALVVSSIVDVRYLTGFTGSSGCLALRGAKSVLFTDGRYGTSAAGEVEGAKVEIVQGNPARAAVEWIGTGRVAYDSAVVTVAAMEAMRGWATGVKFVAMPGLIAGLREVKDEVEQDAMRAAAEMGCRLFHDVLEHVMPGATEMEVAMALEYMARLQGAEGMSFQSIVAGGVNGAMPHARASNAKLPKRGFVVMDFGVILGGYCSDMTRTVHLGAARKGEREAYEAVLEAQEAGIAAVRAGVEAGAVDAACRDVLERAGLGRLFVHSTGHGVGMEIHEGPRVGKDVKSKLKTGMVITIEPGVYVAGQYGIRIEDTVLVTATGCEILTPVTKAWMEL